MATTRSLRASVILWPVARLVDDGRLELDAPRWSRDLPRSAENLKTIQFKSLPPDSELEQIGAFIDRNPSVAVRAYGGYDGSLRDLEFLRYFRTARHVAVDGLYNVESADGLRYLSDDLRSLVLGRTKRRFSLAPLGRFRQLRTLYIEGHSKDAEVLAELGELRSLMLRSVKLPDLSVVRPLRKLIRLDLKLGGTSDLRPLRELTQLQYLELWMVRGLADLSEISGLSGLRYLYLQTLKGVEALPNFEECVRLERIHLETMKGLTDISSLRSAPALRELLLIDMPHLRWEHVQPLVDHPSLERLALGTGSARRNAELRERLGYPDARTPSQDLLKLGLGQVPE